MAAIAQNIAFIAIFFNTTTVKTWEALQCITMNKKAPESTENLFKCLQWFVIKYIYIYINSAYRPTVVTST